MANIVRCPSCGATDFDLRRYEAMMAITPDLALFTLACPHCGTTVNGVCAIPDSLRGTVDAAAAQLGAGMGRKNADGR